MQNTKSKRGQSLLDLIVQQTGSFTDVVQAAILNDKSLSDPLQINETVKTNGITNNNQALVLSDNNPATGLIKITPGETLKGIGVMRVGINFKIG